MFNSFKFFCLCGILFYRIVLFWKVVLINSKVSMWFRCGVCLFYSIGDYVEGGYGIVLL